MPFKPRPESVLTSVIQILYYNSICCLAANQIHHYYLKQKQETKQSRRTTVGVGLATFGPSPVGD